MRHKGIIHRLTLITSTGSITFLVIGLILLVIVVQRQTHTNSHAAETTATQNCSVSQTEIDNTPDETHLLNLINTFRQQNGLSPLVFNDALNQAAAWHSVDMAMNHYMSHTDSLGRYISTRFTDCGYTNWNVAGENIAEGIAMSDSVFSVWESDSGHKAVMLAAKATEAGIDENSGYWTLDVGSRSSAPGTTGTSTQSPTALPSTSQSSSNTPSITNCTPDQQSISNESYAKQLITFINNFRQQHNIAPLAVSQSLTRAAEWHSADEAAHTYSGTTDSLGRGIQERLADCGYPDSSNVIEFNCPGNSAKAIFSQWEADPAHEKYMLDPDYVVVGADYGNFNGNGMQALWVLDMGKVDDSQTISPPPGTITPSTNISPSTSPSTTTTQTGPQVIVSVMLPGIGPSENTTPVDQIRQATLTLYDNSNKEITSVKGNVTYDGNGTFTGSLYLGSQISDGIYTGTLSLENTLSSYIPGTINIQKGTSAKLPPVTLTVGDLNGDNKLSVTDVSYFTNCLQTGTCPTAQLDLNDDGVVNALDYNILISQFQEQKGD